MIEAAFLKYITDFCDRNNIKYDVEDSYIESPKWNNNFFIMHKIYNDVLFYNTTEYPENRVYFKLDDPAILKKLEQLILEYWA